MRINEEIKEYLDQWRPTLGHPDDIEIWKRVHMTLSKFRSLEKEQKALLELIKKRLKEGAIKPSAQN